MYAQKSFKEKLTSLDIYKQLPKGYLQPTCIGAICKKFFLLIYNPYSNRPHNNNVNIFIYVRIWKLFCYQNKK